MAEPGGLKKVDNIVPFCFASFKTVLNKASGLFSLTAQLGFSSSELSVTT